MSEPKGKGWKAALLATGKPLEKSVADRTAEISGTRPIGEYSFGRLNDAGELVEHSVDLRATWSDPGRDIVVDFLVESKYRSRPKMWIYQKSEAGLPGGVSSNALFQNTESFVEGRFFNRKDLRESADYRFALGMSPIEIRDAAKSTQHGQCDDGGRQLAYGTACRIAEAALDTLRDGQLRFVFPIAVTTADLCIHRSSPTMEQVHTASELSDLVEGVDLVVSRFPAPDLEEHVMLRLVQLAKENGRREVESVLASRGIQGVAALAKDLSSKMDGTYLVISYDRLVETMTNIVSYCVAQTQDHVVIRHVDAAKAAVAALFGERAANDGTP